MKALKFHATWCKPCTALSRVVERAGDKITIPIESVDIDQNSQMVVKYAIRGVPTVVVVDDDGKEVRRKTGVMDETELIYFLKDEV